MRDQNELASCPDPKGGVSMMKPEGVLWARKYLMNRWRRFGGESDSITCKPNTGILDV